MTGSPVSSQCLLSISVVHPARSRIGSSFPLPFAKSNFRLQIHFIWYALSEGYTFVSKTFTSMLSTLISKKLPVDLKYTLLEFICFLLILLFSYAGLSKLINIDV